MPAALLTRDSATRPPGQLGESVRFPDSGLCAGQELGGTPVSTHARAESLHVSHFGVYDPATRQSWPAPRRGDPRPPDTSRLRWSRTTL